MSKKVLIAYGTRYGTSEEVSEEIAKILEEEGIETQIISLNENKEKDWPSIENFDGILVGSGIKMNKWTKEPQKFLKRYKNEFKPGKIIGMFVCCGLTLSDPRGARKIYLEDVMENLEVEADLYDAFGPVLDLSKSSRMGFIDKIIVQARMIMNKSNGVKMEPKVKNDFRDWDQIQSFARKFVEAVNN